MKNRIVHCFLIFIAEFKAGKLEPSFHLKTPDFHKVLETTAYVDKSLLIKEIFKNEFSLITAPRKFAKSTNMDMIKKFLEIVVDENGKPISNLDDGSTGAFIENPENQLTENYKLFKKHNLKIYQERQFFYRHCGQHPVIFVNFTGLEGSDFEEILENTKNIIQNTFMEHKYLLKCSDLWVDSEKQTFMEYLELSKQENLNDTQLVFGLNFLSQLLHKHFHKPVFVLIDDYDSSIFDAIVNCNVELDKTIVFLKNLFSKLIKGNLHVQRGLINGRLQLESSEFPEHIVHYSFLKNHNFVKFYGITESELFSTAQKFSKIEKLNEVKDFYGGYNVLGENIEIYNIYSIINYMKHERLENYWAETGDLDEFANFLLNNQIRNKIEQLLNGEEIKIENIINIDKEQIQILHRLLNLPFGYESINSRHSDLLIQFLCETGYLKITQAEPILVRVPNKEIGQEIADTLYTVSFFKKKYKLNSLKIREVNEAIKWLSKKNDTTTFVEFTQAVADLFSDHEVLMPNNYFDFHRALLSFTKNRGQFETVIGNNHFLNGRNLDIMIIRYDGVIVIMEVLYKVQSAYDGLKQLLSRTYDEVIEKEYTLFIERERIYLGLHLSENRTVSVSYLVNSTDITLATNLTSS